ncbi:hypothetical protein PUNSTDRAFT_53203 [Punctularia strigosozonata HHB-11173 SS5]|uniref:uncharacterized protein n=1 Tax=Punctularia strigosozonata (strain HHB-11173) TaxID=741275 RepID=UPI0004417B34|nr:uncharacterized protein PUNSTDRAFT_53203 [Punctularia strigosozonata HHB-11173 SS5]EIN07856.1 hypothetical protein PUNSTDRAFT_53203 [Punctularia strigosozonata HHB-11173 SS5]
MPLSSYRPCRTQNKAQRHNERKTNPDAEESRLVYASISRVPRELSQPGAEDEERNDGHCTEEDKKRREEAIVALFFGRALAGRDSGKPDGRYKGTQECLEEQTCRPVFGLLHR